MVCAMSAWKPRVCGRSTISSSCTLSPPAMHAAPADLAFGGEPFAEVFGDVAGLAESLRDALGVAGPGSLAHSAALAAESMRTMPYWRISRSRSLRPMRQAFRTWARKRARSAASPMAEPPPVGGQTGATSDPARSPLEASLSARRARSSSEESISVCGRDRKRSTPSKRTPSTSAAAVRFSMVSRSMGGSESGPFPTSPGHMALCRAGKA